MRLPVKTTSSCIWVAIFVDWVILHWYACGADGRSVGRSVYGHVFTKFSRMASLPHFLTRGAALRALRAREPRYCNLTKINLYWNNFVPKKTVTLVSTCLQTLDENHTQSSHLFRCPSEKPCKEEKRFPNKIGHFRVPKKSHFQNEAKCETFVVKMSFISVRRKRDIRITPPWLRVFLMKQRRERKCFC